MRLRHLLALAFTLLTAMPAFAATKTTARLFLDSTQAQRGETIMAAIELKMAPRWHTYWRNGGDSGAPTKITWALPTGITAGDILWPVPEKYESADLWTYVYHDQVLLLVPLHIAPDAPAGNAKLSALVSWLECEEICVPGDGQVAGTLTVADRSTPSPDAPLIASWQKLLPEKKIPFEVKTAWTAQSKPDLYELKLSWVKRPGVAQGDFYPYSSEDVEIRNATTNENNGGISLKKEAQNLGKSMPTKIVGLLVEQDDKGKVLAAYEATLPGPARAGFPAKTDAPAHPLWIMLGFSLLGGLILNVMPCVLPVLALKVLGFVNQSKENPARVRQLGLIYMLGVLASFLALAILVLAARQPTWGMQFQNAPFLVLMTVLVTLVALNLFGVFEVNLGGSLMGAATNLAYREGKSGAFFNGVLATALATPCTAPFLTVAIGFAFTPGQSPLTILLVFLMIGLGLAMPYVLLSWFPALQRLLPKPGAWMEKFKVAMGFPMLATAIWLFSILGRHYGNRGVLWVGLFLVVIGLAAWIWGAFVQRGSRGKGVALTVIILVLGTGYFYALEKQLNWRVARDDTAGSPALGHKGGIEWKPWSPEAVAEARNEGRPVFVDFTAEWCVTCQANSATSIEIPSVQAKMKEVNAVALLGDYTLPNAAIAAELRAFQRAGVPLVLVYPKNASESATVLPAVLTPNIVLSALDEAAR